MEILFRKYHNDVCDFLVIDPEHTKFDLLPDNIAAVCSRRTGIGADFFISGPLYDGKNHNFRCFDQNGCELAADTALSRVCSRFLQDTGHLRGLELDTKGVHFIGTVVLGREFINAKGLQDCIPT